MKRIFLILALVGSLLAPTLAQPARAAAPQTGPRATKATAAAPAPMPQAQLVNRVLSNGLEIIVLEDHSVPLVTIELAARNGSYTEPPELNGLSHLYEHMFCK